MYLGDILSNELIILTREWFTTQLHESGKIHDALACWCYSSRGGGTAEVFVQ